MHLHVGDHDYGPNKRFPVYNFFDHYLGLNAGKIIVNNQFDESFVTVLPMEDLRVFNDKNPIPSHALQGDVAVLNYLDLTRIMH